MKIVRIDDLVLEKECNRIVREYNLPRKEWCNVKTILNGMYSYAIRKKYLKENPLEKVQIHVKFRQVVRKTGKTETYNTEEMENLIAFLDRLYEETSDTSYLAVKLNFLLGLRVGELVALKWEDWCDSSHLHIVREEVRDQTDNSYSVPLKSSHKLRKTYASMLNANGVPLDCIREMPGHSSLATTLGYIYNPLTDAETYDLISKAL